MAAATLIKARNRKVKLLVPEQREISLDDLGIKMATARKSIRKPFDNIIVDFLDQTSKSLFQDVEAKTYAELQALAYWIRRSNISRLKEKFEATFEVGLNPAPRGVTFHITPSNVETMPIYSMVLSLVTGNCSVVRVSSRSGPQISILARILNQLLSQDFHELSTLISLIRYDRDAQTTQQLSANCDVRVIWGGDRTVNEIRTIPLNGDSSELVFPDRTSWAVCGAEFWMTLGDDEKNQLLRGLFNDTYGLDQLACSSPHLFIWCGNLKASEQASADFWPRFHDVVNKRGYEVSASHAITKKLEACRVAMNLPVAHVAEFSNTLAIAKLSTLETDSRYHGCGAGFFFEATCSELAELARIVTPFEQTLTYAGVDRNEIQQLIDSLNGCGFSRIVPFGQALNFNYVWESRDLLREFVRVVHFI